MAEALITCPSCKHQFALAESVSKDIRAELDAEYVAKLKAVQELSAQTERDLLSKVDKENQRIAAERRELAAEVARRVAESKSALEAEARSSVDAELRLAQEALEAKTALLRDAQSKEVEFRRKQNEFEDAKAAFELTAARKLDEERAKIREEAESRIGEEHSRKASEWEQKRLGMEKLIEDLKRKSEQGSTQTQGESFELDIETALRETFIYDEVTEVKKGVNGCDIIQKVQSQGGVYAGSIAWELKNTRTWSDGWVQKVKDDAREAKADVAVIVTAAMPKGTKNLAFVEGVWVVEAGFHLGAALVIRSSLFDVAKARAVNTGRESKANALYSYVTGAEFRGRVEQVVEAFRELTDDLAAEKRAWDKQFAKRDKQLARALSGVAGLWGDVSGLTPLPEIPTLALTTETRP